MAGDIISKKTRHEFREYFVGTSLRAIEKAFDEADVRCDGDYQPPCSGQRRTLVERYYHSVDFANWRDVRKVLQVYADVLQWIEDHIAKYPYIDLSEMKATLISLTRFLERDDFRYGTQQSVWWQCPSVTEHAYPATVNNRTSNRMKGRLCVLHWQSMAEIAIAHEIAALVPFDVARTNVKTEHKTYKVDMVLENEGILVEYDGIRFHKGEREVRRDREKTRALTKAGWKVVRIREVGLPFTLRAIGSFARAFSKMGEPREGGRQELVAAVWPGVPVRVERGKSSK